MQTIATRRMFVRHAFPVIMASILLSDMCDVTPIPCEKLRVSFKFEALIAVFAFDPRCHFPMRQQVIDY